MEEHNLRFGGEDPIDLRIARAQAGATNLIWIIRKAKRPEEAEEKNGGKLQENKGGEV